MLQTTRAIIEAIRAIPPGAVSSYRDIALAAGLPPSGARQTVRVLHALSEKEHLPWHRVIRADGRVAPQPCGDRDLQIALLRAEGVQIDDNGVCLAGHIKTARDL